MQVNDEKKSTNTQNNIDEFQNIVLNEENQKEKSSCFMILLTQNVKKAKIENSLVISMASMPETSMPEVASGLATKKHQGLYQSEGNIWYYDCGVDYITRYISKSIGWHN